MQVLDLGPCDSESVGRRKAISTLAMTIREVTHGGRAGGKQLHSYRDNMLTRVMKEGLVGAKVRMGAGCEEAKGEGRS